MQRCRAAVDGPSYEIRVASLHVQGTLDVTGEHCGTEAGGEVFDGLLNAVNLSIQGFLVGVQSLR